MSRAQWECAFEFLLKTGDTSGSQNFWCYVAESDYLAAAKITGAAEDFEDWEPLQETCPAVLLNTSMA
jgi:hypothetical protein